MTPYFEKILYSVARKFVWEVTLHRYLQTLFYTIDFGVVTVTQCYCCSSSLTKTQNFRKNRNIKGALSGLRQFLASESPLKMMKNAFIWTQKLFSFSRYLSFCLNLLVMYFKFHDVTAWLTNNCNTNIAQYLEMSNFASHVCLQ